MGTHQQGHFRRSLYGDLTGLDKRQADGFFSILSGVPQRVIAHLPSRLITRIMSGTIVSMIVDHPQFIHLMIEDPRLARPIFLSHVHASCSVVGRMDLFEGIHQVSQTVDGPWLVGGDFNVIAHDGERTGVSTRDRGKTDFCDMMMECGLTDAGFSGSPYTWHNKRVWKRLDRVLMSYEAASFF
ncbi:RNase H domain-containing protein [Abeliophyllum distichum]|uniref:RNase H domain-containing protein n=1 Tax=Abeliophyllum distichum TaxID=126358 RepID=A0ABD1PS95_9LAMI